LPDKPVCKLFYSLMLILSRNWKVPFSKAHRSINSYKPPRRTTLSVSYAMAKQTYSVLEFRRQSVSASLQGSDMVLSSLRSGDQVKHSTFIGLSCPIQLPPQSASLLFTHPSTHLDPCMCESVTIGSSICLQGFHGTDTRSVSTRSMGTESWNTFGTRPPVLPCYEIPPHTPAFDVRTYHLDANF
jgi:hypothetical protein